MEKLRTDPYALVPCFSCSDHLRDARREALARNSAASPPAPGPPTSTRAALMPGQSWTPRSTNLASGAGKPMGSARLFFTGGLMRLDPLEHAIRTACQIIGRLVVIVVGPNLERDAGRRSASGYAD